MKPAGAMILAVALVTAVFGQSSAPDKVQSARQRYDASGDYASRVFLSQQLRRVTGWKFMLIGE